MIREIATKQYFINFWRLSNLNWKTLLYHIKIFDFNKINNVIIFIKRDIKEFNNQPEFVLCCAFLEQRNNNFIFFQNLYPDIIFDFLEYKLPTNGTEFFSSCFNSMASRWRMTVFAVDLFLKPVSIRGHERLERSLQNPFPSSSSLPHFRFRAS